MYYTYVVQSLKDLSYYKGHTSDLQRRLQEHNAGRTVSIKNKAPFKLMYYETYDTREEAITREKYFKTAAGRRFLKKVISKE